VIYKYLIMERTQQSDPQAILWKKEGGGSLRLRIAGRLTMIKPNQQFYAREEEVPDAFKDVVVVVDPEQAAKVKKVTEKKVEEASAPNYALQHRNGKWWDVVSESGKVQNEKALTKEAAEELLNTLL
jgi:hypothetical protein